MPALTYMGREQFVLAKVCTYTPAFSKMSLEEASTEVKRVIDSSLTTIVRLELEMQKYLKEKYPPSSDLAEYMHQRERHGARVDALTVKISTLTALFVRAEKDEECHRYEEFLWLRMSGLVAFIDAEFIAMEKHIL